MKLGDVLKKERERKRFTIQDTVGRLAIPIEEYQALESGNSPAEDWGPRMARIAIALHTPTSRLISETGKSAQARQRQGQCGKLIASHRETKGLSRKDLAQKVGLSESEMASIEEGTTALETYAPLLLSFSEMIEQPIFNLFYPCGLSLDKLTDYP